MKKQLTFLFLTIFMVLPFSSCKEDVDVAYTKNSIEDIKQDIENEGLAAVQKLDAMKDLSGATAARDLVNIMPSTVTTGYGDLGPVNNLLETIASMDKDPIGLVALRMSNVVDDKFLDMFGKESGIYTWNSAAQNFDRTASSDELTFKFPTLNSTTNNATLTIDNLETITTTNDSFPGQTQPTSLDVKLTSSNSTLFSLELRAKYNSDDLPSQMNTKFEFKEGYEFSEEFTNSGSKAVLEFSYSYKGDEIISTHLESKGDFAYDNFDNGINLSDNEQINSFLNSANAWIKVGNMKLAGVLDFENFNKEMNAKYPEDSYSSDVDNTGRAAIFNKNIKGCLLYAKEKKAIAKTSFYSYEYDLTNSPGYFTVSMKFIFADGSSMDASFFETGFEDLIDAYNNLLTEIEQSIAVG